MQNGCRNVLGKQGKDIVTGFSGTITGHVHYLTGCDQYLLASKADEKADFKTGWFDETRVEIADGDPIKLVSSPDAAPARPGPDVPAPVK